MRSRLRSGYTLVEILTVIAVIAILGALLFGIGTTVMAKARETRCRSNLRQIGHALALYRVDWSDQNPVDGIVEGPPKERLAWIALRPYGLTDGIRQCPDEAGTPYDSLGYIYRSGPRRLSEDKTRTPLGIDPTSATAYCMEHLKKHVIEDHGGIPDYDRVNGKYVGRFLVLRNDGSVFDTDASRVEEWATDGDRWYSLAEAPKGWVHTNIVLRFPGEPWPPEFQF